MKPPVIAHILGCGCRIPFGKLKKWHYKNMDGSDSTMWSCPTHGHELPKVVGFVCKCVDCGIEFYSDGKKHRCPEHWAARDKETIDKYRAKASQQAAMQQERRRALRPPPKKENPKLSMALNDPSRWACGNREACLVEYMQYACLPCKNCERYVLQHGEADAMVARKSEEDSAA